MYGRPVSRSKQTSADQVSSTPSPLSKKARVAAPALSAAACSPSSPSSSASASPTLNEEQQRALAFAAAGHSLFVTGGAGTGKSFLLKRLVEVLPAQSTCVCATTGTAALLVGGTTLHAWAGIALGNGLPQQLLENVEANPGAVTRWRQTTHLVIDEISMLSAKLFSALDFIGRCVRAVDKPFGGIVLILSGDFAQLPPPAGEFCFKSKVWKEAIQKVVVLVKPMRQRESPFFRALNEIRNGTVSDESLQLLNTRVGVQMPEGGDVVAATRLRSRRSGVADSNATQLARLPPGRGVIYRSLDQGSASALADLPAPDELRLKVGAQVMLTRALPRYRNLVNGSRGVVVGFDETTSEHWPMIKFRDGTRISVGPILFSVEDRSRTIASRLQLPLTLAWTMTVHKSQGMSLDAVEVDVSDTFAQGQTYVALSRCTELEGLYLTKAIEKKHCKVNPEVLAFLDGMSERPINLQGHVFVVEGPFKMQTKKEIAKLLRSLGAKIVASLNDEMLVTHAVIGRSTTSTLLAECQSKNVVVWSEEEMIIKCKSADQANLVLKPPSPKNIIIL